MKTHLFNITFLIALLTAGCNSPQTKPVSPPAELTFRFQMDSAGNIINEDVKQKLEALAKNLSHNADRVMLTAYTEQTGDKEKNKQIGFEMAYAAKKFMSAYDERAYFNIGVTIKGYENPVNPNNPADIENRRIEFSYMTQ